MKQRLYERFLPDVENFRGKSPQLESALSLQDQYRRRVDDALYGGGDFDGAERDGEETFESRKVLRSSKRPSRTKARKFRDAIVKENPGVHLRQPLPPEIVIRKSRSKEQYAMGNFEDALRMGLHNLKEAKKCNILDVGLIGFVMNCYNKLRDWPHALEYAERMIAFNNSEGLSEASVGIAYSSAFNLKNWSKAYTYAVQYTIEFGDNLHAFRTAATSAHALQMWPEALHHAAKFLDGAQDENYDEVLWIAIESAFYSGNDQYALDLIGHMACLAGRIPHRFQVIGLKAAERAGDLDLADSFRKDLKKLRDTHW